jgi:hypothetical protein
MKTLNRATIINALTTNPNAVKKALVLLYERQTEDEQSRRDTYHANAQGFNVPHAKEGTRLARKILAGDELSIGELTKGYRIACYYAGTQLLQAAITKQGRTSDAIMAMDRSIAARIAMKDPFQKNPRATPKEVKAFISVFGE